MIGSLNSMSYLKPHSLFDKIFAWLKRTQKVDIKEQYEKYNVRAFDFHFYFVGSSKKTIFKYDGIEYETFSIYEILNYLNSKNNVYARVVLEDNSKNINLEKCFIEYCQKIESIYPKIKFFGGYRENDSKHLYNFKYDTPDNLVFYKRVDKLNNTLIGVWCNW